MLALLTAIFFADGIVPAAADKDNIVKLTKFNFDSNIKKGTWFVKFYAPWCTHCQRLAPIWEKLGDHAATKSWPVKVAEVDCTQSRDVCEKVQVKAFPTLALITNGVLKGRYEGEASVARFEEWLNGQHVLQAGGAEEKPLGQKLDDAAQGPGSAGENSNSQTTATHGAAASAVLSNLLARFPTKSKILNMYIYSGVFLTMLVSILCVVFKSDDSEDEEHDKEN
jgi:protein disulfide-isomerase-like protein